MKILLVILTVIIASNSYAQNIEVTVDTIENTIIKDFSKIDPKKFKDLVPYMDNDLWGYIDRKTKEIVVPAKYNQIEFFNPDMIGYYQERSFVVNKEGKITVEKEEPEQEIMVDDVRAEDHFSEISILSSSDGYKGFKTDSEGKLIAYADIYHYHISGYPTWNVSPFKNGNKTYAIAVNKATGKYGVIDSLGNPLKGLSFNYKSILLNRFAKDKANNWFFVKVDNDNWSLINDQGVYKLHNLMVNHPLTSGITLGYDVLGKNDLSGIFDFYNMKWIVSPQNRIKITSLKYSSTEHLSNEDPKDREKAFIYYTVISGEFRYYVDLKGKPYLPNSYQKK